MNITTSSVPEFRRFLDQVVQAEGKKTGAWVLGVASELHARVIKRTPIARVTRNTRGRSKRRALAARRAGEARKWTLRSVPSRLPFLPAAMEIESNPRAPYVVVLEFGLYPGVGPKTVRTSEGVFSTQAPQGMVRRTLVEFADIVTEVERTLEGA
jgi:hypothetical protein